MTHQRQFVRAVGALVVGFAAALAGDPADKTKPAAKPVPEKMTTDDAQRKLADYWVDVEIRLAGKKLDETDHFGWSFVTDAEKPSPYCWLRRGEAVLSECSSIGVTKALNDGTFHIIVNGFPGLLKFEGHSVVISTPIEGGTHAWGYKFNRLTTAQVLALVRPKDFTSTKENGQVVRIMKRTEGLYGTEPLPDPPAKKNNPK